MKYQETPKDLEKYKKKLNFFELVKLGFPYGPLAEPNSFGEGLMVIFGTTGLFLLPGIILGPAPLRILALICIFFFLAGWTMSCYKDGVHRFNIGWEKAKG